MKRIPLLLLAPALFVLSCKPADNNNNNKPPVVPTTTSCFTVDKTLVDSGEAITFTNCSANASTYLWNLGDSQSTEKSPVHAYRKTRTSYKVELNAFNSDKSQKPTSSSLVYLGHRKYDSVRINAITSTAFKPGLDYLFQFGYGSNSSAYSLTKTAVASLPTTFDFSKLLNDSVYIVHNKNDNAWKGRLVSQPEGPFKITFGASNTIFLSRGLHNSPIHVVDNGVDMDWYYHIVK